MTKNKNISSGKWAALSAIAAAFVTSIALLIASCTIDRRDPNDPDVLLSFSPAMYMQVDGELLGGYPDDRPFSVWAWVNDAPANSGPASTTSGSSPNDGSAPDDAPVVPASAWKFIENSKVVHISGDLWTPDVNVYWPSRDKRMTVIASAPYGRASSCSLSEGVTFSDVDMTSESADLLYSIPQTSLDKMEDGGKVPVPFNHALCQIAFRVKNRADAPNNGQIRLRRLTIDGVLTRGTFHSLPEPSWTLAGAPSPLTFFEGDFITRNVSDPVGVSRLAIPQDLDTFVTVEYDLCTPSGTTTHTATSGPLQTALQSGRRYIYTLSIGLDDIRFISELIEHDFTTEN